MMPKPNHPRSSNITDMKLVTGSVIRTRGCQLIEGGFVFEEALYPVRWDILLRQTADPYYDSQVRNKTCAV